MNNLNDIYGDANMEVVPSINRTVRDDITLFAVQSALFVNNNKDSISKRSFKIDADNKVPRDGVFLTSTYMESFIDAMTRVYANNVEKINSYSFKITSVNDKRSLPEEATVLMKFCQDQIIECGIPFSNMAFGDAIASISEDNRACVGVIVYMAPFAISNTNTIQISRWNKVKLFMKELCRIIVSK